ncbi:DUF1444 family protein [Shewanella cyperi]|uniref:DUF1444 family protein n=1 Tax=Shewanella cyperi TaxID=2814292 RepID=A0A974XN22_9GAMM|nr:DUF1444 family protein [Shewanella cyperi]QSX31364.1 DUF1444 family protein [Shewanella cyperi]
MKKIAMISLFILGWISTTFAETFLDKKEFTNRYVAAVAKIAPNAKIEVIRELEVNIALENDNKLNAILDNAYADYKSNPGNIDNLLATYAESIFHTKDLVNVRHGKEQIFPVVKDKQYIQQVDEMLKKSGKGGIVYEKINDVLYVLYAFDTPKALRFMTESDLSEINVNKNELRDLSKTNLKNSIPNLKLEGDPSSLAMLIADGTYEASFILFDDIWTKEQFPVKGDIVVYIPTRDLVLITGSEDEVSLAKIHNIIYAQGNQWSHTISEVGFVRVNNSWHIFQP